ncbi:MAG TPA: hypothetical protein VGB76_17160 [Pyrinomonadaceae bacterium]|jgi:outer membrane protein assembly factor BamE (lipoprotein component of BamABCDE complex)
MFQDTNLRSSLNSFRLPLLLAAFILCLAVVDAAAQTQASNANPASPAPPAAADEVPAFQEYKGVRIGMTADEARKKLGSPTDKGDAQDFYLVSPKENVQVMYDASKKVSAIALIYMNAGANAPTAKAVMGTDLEAKPDGSLYKLVRYPKAGYWVSYSRTAGNSPIVSVTMQKIN